MRNFLLFVLFIGLLGLVGHFDYEDAVRSAEYDRYNKQEVIKDWQVRCATGDIFDADICKAVMKGGN